MARRASAKNSQARSGDMSESLITKKALAAAMKELMQSADFEKITVGDICAHCGITEKHFTITLKTNTTSSTGYIPPNSSTSFKGKAIRTPGNFYMRHAAISTTTANFTSTHSA
jgi:hypothetical protein